MYSIKNDNEILIYDEIFEGYTARQVIEKVREMTGAVTLRINSQGGDVFEAIALYNLLKAHEVTVYVDGLCASAASVIAMSGQKIIMGTGSLMMIHNPMSYASGDAQAFSDMAEVLNKIRDCIAGIYEAKTGLSHDEIISLMAAETWMTGQEAVQKKFADELTESTTPNETARERERLRELDSIRNESNAAIIDRAKYETGQSAKDIALELLRVNARVNDSKNIPVISAKVPASNPGSEMGSIISKLRGWQ